MRQRKQLASLGFPLILLLAIGLSVGMYLLSYTYDNKYTRPAPGANSGILRLDMGDYAANPLLFLVNGWEFYQYRLLTPEEVGGHSPDAYLFIGQYGGFELGDPEASPHGSATYRLTIFTDGVERDYALELPEIYSAYRVWVNGDLKASAGTDDPADYRPATANRFIAFSAGEKVEIVIAVTDYTHFYSGVTYPPAFGSPEAVARMLGLRLAIRGMVLGAAALLGVLCILLAVWQQFSGTTHLLALLCLCFIGYTAYPIVHTIPLTGEIWYDMEQVSYYAMYLVVIWLQGRLCGLPKRVYRSAVAVAALPCLSIPLYRRLWMDGAAAMYAYSGVLSGYILLAGLYLLASTVYAMAGGSRYSRPLLCGFGVFAAALVVDRAYPWFEPVLLGWHTELAGFTLVLVSAGIVGWDTALAYRERQALREDARLHGLRMDILREKEQMQRQRVQDARAREHEVRHRLLAVQSQLHRGDIAEAERSVFRWLGEGAARSPARYTDNELVDLLLSTAQAQADLLGVELERKLLGIPERLAMEDRDLSTLLMNLLDNALDACAVMPAGSPRWVRLEIRYFQGALSIVVENPYAGERRKRFGRYFSTKVDSRKHGHGLRNVGQVVRSYGGTVEIRHSGGVFHTHIRVNPGSGENTASTG